MKIGTNKKEYNFVDVLKFFFMLCVIAIHCNIESIFGRTGWYILHCIFRLAVPFFFEGIQNVSLFSLIYLFAKNIEEVSKLETPLSTISIFIFVFPLVVSLFIFFEKKRAYKFNELLNCAI